MAGEGMRNDLARVREAELTVALLVFVLLEAVEKGVTGISLAPKGLYSSMPDSSHSMRASLSSSSMARRRASRSISSVLGLLFGRLSLLLPATLDSLCSLKKSNSKSSKPPSVGKAASSMLAWRVFLPVFSACKHSAAITFSGLALGWENLKEDTSARDSWLGLYSLRARRRCRASSGELKFSAVGRAKLLLDATEKLLVRRELRREL